MQSCSTPVSADAGRTEREHSQRDNSIHKAREFRRRSSLVHMLFPTAASSRPPALPIVSKARASSRAVSRPFSSQFDNIHEILAVIGASCVTCAHSSGIPIARFQPPPPPCATPARRPSVTQNSTRRGRPFPTVSEAVFPSQQRRSASVSVLNSGMKPPAARPPCPPGAHAIRQGPFALLPCTGPARPGHQRDGDGLTTVPKCSKPETAKEFQ